MVVLFWDLVIKYDYYKTILFMSLESIHTSSTAREEAIERLRETFEQRAKELADKYSVDSSEVLYLYALKMGRQVEKIETMKFYSKNI